MLNTNLLLLVFSIWLATILISLRQKQLRNNIIKNGLFALIYTTVFIIISFYINNRDSIFYNLFALMLLGLHSIIILIYTLFIVIFRTGNQKKEI